jgi:hypothetical protein
MIWTKALTGKACPFTADIVVNEYREASGWNGSRTTRAIPALRQ